MSDYEYCPKSKSGKHDWTPFEFSRWITGIPGDEHEPWKVLIRHCKLCNLHNEEIDGTSLPEGYYLDSDGIVEREIIKDG